MKNLPIQQDHNSESYSLLKIINIWALSALPMGFLAFVATPWWISNFGGAPVLVYWWAMLLGLLWQLVLAVLILRHEGLSFKWEVLRTRLKFQAPINPLTGKKSYHLLWWTLPFILGSAVIQSGASGLPNVDEWVSPFLGSLPQYDLSGLNNGEFKGAWWLLPLFLFTALLNYLLGEELMYRGILLPKMHLVFGKWDWLVNGFLFGLYHLHKPHIILSTGLYFGLLFSFPARYFQSTWMAVIIHGLEGVLGLIMVLSVILA